MGEIFSTSGENSNNVGTPPPFLQGVFIPGIDNQEIQDGFGLVIPLGGGKTAKRYAPYGISIITGPQENQLYDLSKVPAEGANFSFEGLIGPQGIAGRDGIDGIIQVIVAPNSSFLTALPHNIDEINGLGTAADLLVYTNTYTTVETIAGVELTSGTTNGNTIPTSPTSEEREITLDTPVELTSGVKELAAKEAKTKELADGDAEKAKDEEAKVDESKAEEAKPEEDDS
ncbi:hypothetical protein LCGC14_2330720, partial [marine sediment metagenome]